MPGLSPQREKFAQAGASGMNQSDAYRAAYRVRHGTTMVFVNQSASRVMADVNVASMVAELRAPAAKKASITLESHLAHTEQTRTPCSTRSQNRSSFSPSRR
jgi:hypothetical protein